MLGFQGGVSIPLVKGGVKAPPAKRQCRAAPKAVARRGFTPAKNSHIPSHFVVKSRSLHAPLEITKAFPHVESSAVLTIYLEDAPCVTPHARPVKTGPSLSIFRTKQHTFSSWATARRLSHS